MNCRGLDRSECCLYIAFSSLLSPYICFPHLHNYLPIYMYMPTYLLTFILVSLPINLPSPLSTHLPTLPSNPLSLPAHQRTNLQTYYLYAPAFHSLSLINTLPCLLACLSAVLFSSSLSLQYSYSPFCFVFLLVSPGVRYSCVAFFLSLYSLPGPQARRDPLS